MVAVAGAVFTSAVAAPIRLTVKPEGTNQLELTITPIKPDAIYYVLARTNRPGAYWLPLTVLIGATNETLIVHFDLGQMPPCLKGFSLESLSRWSLVAGSGNDSDGDGLPDIYEDLVTRTDPFNGDTGNWGIEDGYKDLDGDDWSNLQEFQNNSNPLEFDQPPSPTILGSRPLTNGNMLFFWAQPGGTPPEYFVVERAERKIVPPKMPPPPQPGQPRFRPPSFRQATYETSPFVEVARVPTEADKREYSYVDTNSWVINVREPRFRVFSHYQPLKHATPTQVNERAIRGTVRRVVSQPTTNGYDLRVERPVPHARYLLLCRPHAGSPWIASGYFAAATNDTPILLYAQTNGMLLGPVQRPIAMPDVQFVPASPNLEFTAGSGEDSDGDGLPDIYEVLVTRTEPDNADTGHTGILDGYKDLDGDGWSNLEEFRRRTDPVTANPPPPPLELKRPQFREVAMAFYRSTTDLRWQPVFEIRKAGERDFSQLIQPVEAIYFPLTNPQTTSPDFDLKISWRVPDDSPRPQHHGGP